MPYRPSPFQLGYKDYVLVLIDGNRTNFLDEDVARDSLGGYAAADKCREDIEKSVKEFDAFSSVDTAIAITVFADLQTLATSSLQASLPIRDFAESFNDTHLLTKFQNIGETTPTQASLERMLEDLLKKDECLQVIFVGPTWETFERFAEHQDRDGQRRLLLKTSAIPLPSWLRDVKEQPHTHTVSYNEPQIQHAKSKNNRAQRICASIPIAAPILTKSEAVDTNTKAISIHNSRNIETINIRRSVDMIPRNRAGQRVDPPVNSNKVLRLQMSREKWCSNHQLKGVCPFADCEFKHDLLDEAGRNALLSLARGNPCRRGNRCADKNCYAGHHCPYDPCLKGRDCSFSKRGANMHVHDKQIVNM